MENDTMRIPFGEILYLNREDVIASGGLDMVSSISQIETMLALFDRDECVDPPKSVLRWSDDPNIENTRGRINFLSGYVGGDINALGMKWIGSFPSNKTNLNLPRATAIVVLNDADTGIPIAFMEGSVISSTRTAAITGVAVKHLAPRNTKIIGMIGAGVLSKAHLLMLHEVLDDIETIQLYNPTRRNGEKLKDEIEKLTGINVRLVDSARAAFDGSDIALTATTTHDPIVQKDWIKPGMLTIQFAGHEFSFDAVSRADKIVCDDWNALKHRAIMTPAKMYEAGKLSDADIYADLGAIVTGRKNGRENDNEIIHFASVGMGLSDVALAAMIYQNALDLDLGTRLPLWNNPD